MRFVRLGALFGSLVLLVATSVSLFNRRADIRSDQDVRVVAASVDAENAIDSTILRARAVLDVAGPDTTATQLVSSFGSGAAACVDNNTGSTCTGADLFSLGGFGDAASASRADDGRTVAVVDGPSDSVLVVSRSVDTVAIQLPTQLLVDASSGRMDSGIVVEMSLSENSADGSRSAPETVDGRRVVRSVVADPLDAGSILLVTSVADDSGLLSGADVLAVALILLGAVLLALAGWTFLVERRSLEKRATTDELTGLVNRREFERECEDALLMADRFGTGVCVMLIDLNGFKQINDSMGHQFGDVVLKACAERLVHAVRETDVGGRWGGDEFVILLPGLEAGTAVRNSAERISAGLSRTPVAGDVYITGSVGAALYPRHGTTLDELMRSADMAMYGAKTSGVTMRMAEPIGIVADDPDARSGYDGPDRRKRRENTDTNVV